MGKFKRKRESLELFVKEQLIGPGAYNLRYHLQSNFGLDYYKEDLNTLIAFEKNNEIIPEVPAYQYSTAILFPKTRINPIESKSESTEEFEEENEEEGENTSADDEELKSDFSESLISKQQNYPNQFGVSFVVDSDFDTKDLDISFSFRQYKKLTKEESIQNGLSIFIPENTSEISKAITTYFSNFFSIEKIESNYFVVAKKLIELDEFYDIDYIYLNKFLHDNLIKTIHEHFKENLIKEQNKSNEFWGIKIEERKTNFYKLSTEKRKNREYNKVYTVYDKSLIEFIKKSLYKTAESFKLFEEIITQIEVYNQLKNILNDFKAVFRSNKPLPLWEAKSYNLPIELPLFLKENGNIQRFKPSNLSLDFPSLKYALQYLIDRKNPKKLHVKIIISNDEIVFLKENEPPWLNKKDEANLKSFFGVKLQVNELKQTILKEYNPPQLINIDPEDNFNKLLYRNFKDYGEGYNTSVTWGKNKDGFKFISTEFLPEQETPSVDFRPSKLENKKIVSRLQNDDILSFRKLSTLSQVSDEEIISGLEIFIQSYKIWIDEKRQEAKFEEEKTLLNKQLDDCEKDFKRLKRNIHLLANSDEGMISFRLMNTAMFMQLHHNILIKNHSNDLKRKLTEEYYENVEIPSEYKWRSFQLAFILLNVDAFIKPVKDENINEDVFNTGWPERNEIADLVWFPTGGGKTEAYLGIISFCIVYRRFTKKEKGYGTAVLMRYTLRLLTLQQFQRATLLICALEAIRKDEFSIPYNFNLGEEKITIGLFVGADSLPNWWKEMRDELNKIRTQLESRNEEEKKIIKTNLPFNSCPWCGEELFQSKELNNLKPRPQSESSKNLGINEKFLITCHNSACTYHHRRVREPYELPIILFDEDIYKFPPTLLFGTVDKFAALANRVSKETSERKEDSRRFFGKGYSLKNSNGRDCLPPELIIQDELHLLLGPLGTAVGLFEKSIDFLCTYEDSDGNTVKPKIITSTATTRNTNKQIFALFNRRSEIFPKQGIAADDSFFAFYKRNNEGNFISNRNYMGVLPVGKTQVWMQLRLASIALAHRIKHLKENISSIKSIFNYDDIFKNIESVQDYYHTVLSYFNSLKEVGKTQSQLSHYLPGDINYIVKNTIPWSFLDQLIRDESQVKYSELTGRLNGEEVKTNLNEIEKRWKFLTQNGEQGLNNDFPPDFVISTNMISVGIDISRFNTMIISSMPRNIAEYIQASSRVARDKEGIVFTVHHPFRSRDISHYQRFKEFHQKFYSYVEPISVTPFATKALDRYLPMMLATIIRHNEKLELTNSDEVLNLTKEKAEMILEKVKAIIDEIHTNSSQLNDYLKDENKPGIVSNIDGIIDNRIIEEILEKTNTLLRKWLSRLEEVENNPKFKYRNSENFHLSLFTMNTDSAYPNHWKVGQSLREIAPTTVIKTVQQ